MRVIKKYLCFFMILALLMPNLVVAADENGENDSESKYDHEISVLSSLGIIAKDKYKPEEMMTRAEFALAVKKMIFKDDVLIHPTDRKFLDFNSTSPNYQEISMLLDMGILHGVFTDFFSPDQPIIIRDAAQILVCILGYDLKAKQSGGYPTGYIAYAGSLGLTKGLSLESDRPLSKGEAASMLFRALSVDLMLQDSLGDANQIRVTTDGTNILSKYHSVYKREGRISGNEFTNISGTIIVPKGKVAIDNEVFAVGSTPASELVGRYVEIYYRIEDNKTDKTIIYIRKSNKESGTLIKASDIEAYENRQYKYYGTGKDLKKMAVPANIDVFYNGEFASANQLIFVPKKGYVELIDANNDGNVDTLFIWEYVNLVVSGIDSKEKKAYGKNFDVYKQQNANGNPSEMRNNVIDFDDRNGERNILVYDDGKPAKFEMLKEWDVVSAYISLTGKNIKALVAKTKISGTVQEHADIDGVDKYVIDDVLYALAAGYSNTGDFLIDLDYSGDFYLDIDGNIAAFRQKKDEGMAFGFLIKIQAKQVGLNNGYEFKLYSSTDKKVVTYKIAQRISIDGATLKSNTNQMKSEVERIILNYTNPTTKNYEGGIIRYQLDEDGVINKVDTVYKGASESVNSLFISYSGSARFNRACSSFAEKIIMSDKTQVFLVPVYSKLEEKEQYRMGDNTWVYDDDVRSITAYNTRRDFSGEADVILYAKNFTPDINDNDQVAVIENITTAVDKEGIPLKKLYFGKNASKVSAFVSEKISVGNLQPGDIIQYGKDYRGYIERIDVIYNYKLDQLEKQSQNLAYSSFRTVKGYVYSNKDGYLRITQLDPGVRANQGALLDSLAIYPYKKFKSMLFDSTGPKPVVRVLKDEDIFDFVNFPGSYSKVIVQTTYGDPLAMIFYK